MTWILLAASTAFFESLKDVAGKKCLLNIDASVVAWAMKFFALPFLLPLIIFIPIPPLKPEFWGALVIGGSLNVVTSILYMKALQASDISLTVPMLTFTPLFLIVTSPLIVHEFPSPWGILGILLIVFGSYRLNLRERHKEFFAPFRAIVEEKGPRLMLIVAFIWSITSNFDKIGVQSSSPFFWTISVSAYIMVGMLPFVYNKLKKIGIRNLISSNFLIFMGLFFALSMICQMTAVTFTLVAYVIAIKRTSALMSVFWGHFIFKEKGLRERLIGVIAMLVGVIIISVT